jgi:hypothetical protein
MSMARFSTNFRKEAAKVFEVVLNLGGKIRQA